ncbi:hypothetical protein [Streptomyces sp. bgisy027]|uniref:hypothetical protein n=1 Tax=unclassified Streptomyces TaxID=2593676 RepID=UPI003D708F05
MTPPAIDAHVRLDVHPTHAIAVTATLTGTRQDLAHPLLTSRCFEALDDHTLVMARIDREESYWTDTAAQALTAQGITTQIIDRLQKAMDEEWVWASHSMPWRTPQRPRGLHLRRRRSTTTSAQDRRPDPRPDLPLLLTHPRTSSLARPQRRVRLPPQ